MELIFNIWFIVDIGTGLCGYAIVKPYAVEGTDSEKYELLRSLAETDYITSHRVALPKGNVVSYSNMDCDGYIHYLDTNSFFDANLDYFLRILEEQLPPIFKFCGDEFGENIALKQQFSDSPLFVKTILMENEFGEIKPFTSKENKKWYENEMKRIQTLF